MKSLYNIFVLPLVVALLWSPLSVAASPALKSPIITLRDVSLVTLNFDAAHFLLELDVHNENPKDIVVEAIVYSVILNQMKIKSGRVDQQERFLAQSERPVRVPFTLLYDENLPDIIAALSSAKSSTYEISGSVKLQGIQTPLPFHHAAPLLLPRFAKGIVEP